MVIVPCAKLAKRLNKICLAKRSKRLGLGVNFPSKAISLLFFSDMMINY